MSVNYVILIENGYVLHDYWKVDVLREAMNARKRWWRGPRMVVLTSTEPVLWWI
jgi:hypothetical protein